VVFSEKSPFLKTGASAKTAAVSKIANRQKSFLISAHSFLFLTAMYESMKYNYLYYTPK
jgi:hypothetical protein